MDDLKIIIDSFGEKNEEIEDDELANIEEEIDSIDEEEYFELAKISIRFGKPQILEYLIKNYVFEHNEIEELCVEIKKFQRSQIIKTKDLRDRENIEDIMEEYDEIIKNWRKLPYRKNNHNSRKF